MQELMLNRQNSSNYMKSPIARVQMNPGALYIMVTYIDIENKYFIHVVCRGTQRAKISWLFKSIRNNQKRV